MHEALANVAAPRHLQLCQPCSRHLPRPWGLGGRPCAFPAALGSLGGPAAVVILPAAAAADPRGSPRQSDRAARRHIAAGWRACGRGLGTRDQWRRLRRLGPVGRVLGRRHRSAWREQSTGLSDACKRGSGNATRAGKERRADVLTVTKPSSWLAGARDGRSPGAVARRSRRNSSPAALVASWMVPVAVR